MSGSGRTRGLKFSGALGFIQDTVAADLDALDARLSKLEEGAAYDRRALLHDLYRASADKGNFADSLDAALAVVEARFRLVPR